MLVGYLVGLIADVIEQASYLVIVFRGDCAKQGVRKYEIEVVEIGFSAFWASLFGAGRTNLLKDRATIWATLRWRAHATSAFWQMLQ